MNTKKYLLLDFIKLTCLTLTLSMGLCAIAGSIDDDQFQNINRSPDAIMATTETGAVTLQGSKAGIWTGGGITVATHRKNGGLSMELSARGVPLMNLTLRWNAEAPHDWEYLGDAWERAYGDLEWKPLNGTRVMPWYFLVSNGTLTHGYGVKTRPGALCYWTADANGITLHADVRCGGLGVELGQRKLEVCTVICRRGRANETAFAADRAFCAEMCTKPRLPKQSVYGFNNWYCTYGHDTADEFLTNAAFVVSLSPKNGDRPFAVVDGGWQKGDTNGAGVGFWNDLNPEFSRDLTMPELAVKIRELGARPGLWYRPLLANGTQPPSWRLERDPNYLDPTVPAVRAFIRQTIARFHTWGYELIKNDFSTYDLCGRWGMQMGSQITPGGWAFADRSKTTAEVIRDLYQDMREGAGNGVLIEGCNTMGHLSAGLFELQRIGDDTSGYDWSRTRKMGVNSLAFRLPQNGTFFASDADCVGEVSSNSVPWAKTTQWLNLLSHSGAPLFVSFRREDLNPDQKATLRGALTAASQAQAQGEPLDWMSQHFPSQWNLDQKRVEFFW